MKTPPPGFEHVVVHKHHHHKHRPSHHHGGSTYIPSHGSNIPYRPITCRNCGIVGHLYKDCVHPIMSFGIICYRWLPHMKEPEYIMIQRKDSLSFMEFIRGKYDLANFQYIGNLLSSMTMQEREYLLTWSFEQLWNYVWYQPSIPRHTNEFGDAKAKFDTLRSGYCLKIHGVDTLVHLAVLLQVFASPFCEPEWGFPKGRRRLLENDEDCAIREFCEETGFQPGDITRHSEIPALEEIFYGTNHILYRHVYYLARLDTNQERIITIDPDNLNQAREVRAVRWFKASQVMGNIRPHNQERRQLFATSHQVILDFELRRFQQLHHVNPT